MIVGFCNGCFDDLHDGHLYFLEQASRHCDYLVCAVNNDESVRRLKGETRPIRRVSERLYALIDRAGAFVDAVIPFDGDPGPLIQQIRPHIIIRGFDQMLERHGVEHVTYISRLGTISTTELENARRSLS